MFKVKFLPARFGDCIWIEYGDERAPHRLLIDGGTRGTRHAIRRKLLTLPSAQRRFELLVVSHIDRDHIEGILSLLSENEPGFEIGDLWFNGWGHLPDNPEDEQFGAVQGERLTARILQLELPWNRAFDGRAVCTPPDGPLPESILPGGLRLTLLSPTPEALAKLKPKWEQEVRKANLDPGFGREPNDDLETEEEELGGQDLPDVEALAARDFADDRSEANGSSIAFLAEFEGKRALFAADTPAGMLQTALERLSPENRLALNLFKISHHGSRSTTSRSLIEKVDCPVYAFSTNGSIFKHPHDEAVSRVIVAGGDQPELVFNYRTVHNEVWDLSLLKRRHGYRATYPADSAGGIDIEL